MNAILRAELTATLRRPMLALCAAVFFFLAFQTMSITSPTASGVIRIGRLWHNSPYIVAKLTAVLGVAGLFVAALLIAPAVQRDFHHRAHPFFLSLPVTRAGYLLGRFTGAFGATLLVFAGAMAGVLAAALSIPPELIGPHRWIAFVQPLLLFAVPNLLLAGAICFAVATLTRSMVGVYVTAVVLMVVLGVGQGIVDEALRKGAMHGAWATAGALAEPFGAAALQIVTASWSPAEKNVRAIPMASLVLVHRLVWSGIALGLLAFTVRRFRAEDVRGQAEACPTEGPRHVPAVGQASACPQPLRQFATLTMRELRLIIGHLAFVVLALATLANLNSNFLGNVRGQHVHPRTGFFLEHALRDDAIVIVLTVFFAGIVAFRERGHRTHEIVDSQPLPNWVLYGSKLSALLLMQTAYAVLVMGYGIFVQLVLYRYTHLELDVYFAAVFGVKLLGWWAIAAFVLLLQAVAPNAIAGYAMSGIAIGAASFIPSLGLLRPGFAPPYVYSDMNGFGHYAAPLVWYRAYWLLITICLVIAAAMLWPRGATRRFRATPVLAAALLGAIGCAAVILYNTRQPDNEALRAAYERKYRRYLGLPQPRVEAVDLSADFFPRQRRVHLRGTMTLRNTTGVPIDSVHVTLLTPARQEGYTIITLASPLAPGNAVMLRYEYDLAARGFSEDGHLVRNGSVIAGNDPEFFPHIGYQSKLELSDRAARVRHGLPPVAEMTGTKTPSWTTFHAVVSTDADQQPVASGDRVREWTRGNRRIAEFKTSGVAGTLFMLGSGDYVRAAERVGAVEVEILHHRDHAANLRSMFSGVKCGLAFGGRHFAAYPYRTLRIVELPAYTMRGNAHAFSGIILWGERGGFITDVARDRGVDRVFSTAAHEAGHQWWGNSALVLNEVLSDDVRVQCLDEAFGTERTVEFLREMRAWYFRGREREPELPLRGGGQTNSSYILMWRLRRLLGNDAVNAALRDVVAEFGYRPDRIPTPRDVAAALERHAPPDLVPLIEDTFDRITIHPVRAREARAVKLGDGRYRLTVTADLRKTYGERPAPLEGYKDWIDVAVYSEDGRVLSLATHRITDPRRGISVVVDAPPSRVVIDPLCTLLDADASDNEVAVP